MEAMQGSHGLEPPLTEKVADPGAHQLAEGSDSEDQFTDAQSIPRDSSSFEADADREDGTVPSETASGSDTEKHTSKGNDIEHEEEETAAVIPHHEADATTPEPEIFDLNPPTVVHESSGELPEQHSAEVLESREADASPDIVIGPDQEAIIDNDSHIAGDIPPIIVPDEKSESAAESMTEEVEVEDEEGTNGGAEDGPDGDGDDDGDDNFDDDFDEFEDGDGQHEDFADFEHGFQQPDTQQPPPPTASQLSQTQPQWPYPIPDFDGTSPDQVIASIDPCLPSLFPPETLDFPPFPSLPQDSIFLTPRSASLWSQLVAPPPLAPPDWIRSYTRRLFLVSLGVPVDLDEILPASKQKKLILPSSSTASRASASSAAGGKSAAAAAAVPGGGSGSGAGASTDDQGGGQASGSGSSGSRRRKGPPPEPELDLVAARHLCQTTDEALGGMTGEELREHVAKLEAMQGVARELLEYWSKRTDEKIGDREAFEGVIENLVAHARKVRK